MGLRFWKRTPNRAPLDFLDTVLLARLPRWDGPVPGPVCESFTLDGSRCTLPATATVAVREADVLTYRRVCERHA